MRLRKLFAPVLLIAATHCAALLAASPIGTLPAITGINGPDFDPAATRRPIWMLEVARDKKSQPTLQYAAVDPLGQRLAAFGEVQALSWSPDGRRYAFSSISQKSGQQIIVKTADGGRKVVGIRRPYMIVPWQIAWSPDGRRLAFLAYTTEKKAATRHSLIIMESDWSFAEDPFVAEYNIPAGTVAYPPLTAPSDKLRWSPDGQRILVSWGNTVVVDAGDGHMTTIHPERAAASWTPRNEVLYLAMRDSQNPPARNWSGLFLRRLDAAQPVQLADAAQLAQLGLLKPGLNNGILDVSPDGKTLALSGGEAYSRPVLQLFSFADDGSVPLQTPQRTFTDVGNIVSLDWAPTSDGFAVTTMSFAQAAGQGPEMANFTTTVIPLTGSPKALGVMQLPAAPEYLDLVALFRTVSWSR